MPARTLLLAFVLLFAAACSGPDAPRPGVFTTAAFAEAQSAALAADKLFVVDVMAEWCGPCKQMDAETWVHSDVIAYLDESAVAYQLDSDHDPAAQGLGVEYLPTIIVYRGGQELGRKVGYQSPRDLIGWLKSLQGTG